MTNFNTTVFDSINQGAGKSAYLDSGMVFITHYMPYVMIALVVIYMVWWFPKRYPGAVSSLYRLAQSIEFICSLAMTYIVVQFIKVAIASPRPFAVLPHTVLLIPDQGGFSFPSMHTALTTAVAMSVLIHHRRLGLLLLVFALLVGVSRIFVGVHYPVDVLIGAVLGGGIALLVHLLFSRISRHTDA